MAGITGAAAGPPNQLHDRQPAAPTASVDTTIKTRNLFITAVSYQEMVGPRAHRPTGQLYTMSRSRQPTGNK
jgi:hypothetical protein